MQNNTVTYSITINGSAISDSLQVNTIEIENTNGSSTAVFSVVGNSENKFEVPGGISTGNSLVIGLGYDSSNQTAFSGKVQSIRLNTEEGQGIAYFFKAVSAEEAKPTATPTISAEDIFDINMEWEDANAIEGYIKLQGTLGYGVGTPVPLGDVMSGWGDADTAAVKHHVEAGSWFTTLVFDGLDSNANTDTKAPAALQDSVVLQDNNGNKITLDKSGVSIQSPTTISINGVEKASINGNTVAVGATESISLSGASIKQNADMEMNITGGMTTTVKGGTELSLKGAMVMIN